LNSSPNNYESNNLTLWCKVISLYCHH